MVPKPSMKVVIPDASNIEADPAILRFKNLTDLIENCNVLLPTEYCMGYAEYELSEMFSDDEFEL